MWKGLLACAPVHVALPPVALLASFHLGRQQAPSFVMASLEESCCLVYRHSRKAAAAELAWLAVLCCTTCTFLYKQGLGAPSTNGVVVSWH